MKSLYIDNRIGLILILYFFTGSLYSFTGSITTTTDIWISIIIAAAISVPLYLMYSYIVEKFNGKNLFQVITLTFGNTISKLLILVYILYAFLSAMLNANGVVNYIKYNDLNDTPKLFISLFLAMICIYAVKFGLTVLGNFSNFFSLFVLLSIIIAIVFSYNIIDFNNILPVVSTNGVSIFINSLHFISHTFGEVILLLGIAHFDNKGPIKKMLLKSLAIALVIFLIIYIKNILVLGPNLFEIVTFPNYYATSLIKSGDFFQRYEIYTSILLILTSLVKISVTVLFIHVGLMHLFKLDNYTNLSFPITYIIIGLSNIFFFNDEKVNGVLKVYPFIGFFFQFLIPFTIFMIILFNHNSNKSFDANKKMIKS